MGARTRFILIKAREEYLINSYQTRDGIVMNTTPDIFEATPFKAKRIVSILDKFKKHNIDAMSINFGVKKKLYFFIIEQHHSLINYKVECSYEEVNIEKYVSKLSEQTPKQLSLHHTYYFKNNEDLFSFMVKNKNKFRELIENNNNKILDRFDNYYKVIEDNNPEYKKHLRGSKFDVIINNIEE